MELQTVTFKQAKALNELGFPQHLEIYEGITVLISRCGIMGTYDEFDYDTETYACPTLDLVSKWLREEKNIYVFVNMSNPSMTGWSLNNIFTYDYSNGGKILIRNQGCYASYESALSAGIDKAIKVLQNKNFAE